MHKDILAILADYATYHIISRIMPENKMISAHRGHDIYDYDRVLVYNNKIIIYNKLRTYRLCYKTKEIIMEYVYINNNIYNTYIDINNAITYYAENSIFLSQDELHIHITMRENKIELQIVLYYDIDNVYIKYYDISAEFREIFRDISTRYRHYRHICNWSMDSENNGS